MKQFTLYSIVLLLLFTASTLEAQRKLTRDLQRYCSTLSEEFDEISPERQADLQELGQYLYEKASQEQEIKLTVICTHNSRRSHMGQLWSMVAAEWFGIDNLQAFSGGTEATAFNPRAIAALEHVGFKITAGSGDNPHYLVTYAEDRPALECFSKTYDHSVNPSKYSREYRTLDTILVY